MRRADDYREFAENWLGRPLSAADRVRVPPNQAMPLALREMYETFGSVIELTQPHNRLLAPTEIRQEGAYTVFYVENQEVAIWGFRQEQAHLDDPEVIQGHWRTEGLEWHSEGLPIGEWIRFMTFWQLVNGGYRFGAYSAGIDGAASAVALSLPLIGTHPKDPLRFYGIPGQLICLSTDTPIPSVWAAGRTLEDFNHLNAKLNFSWDTQ
jgi:hypothetical protein